MDKNGKGTIGMWMWMWLSCGVGWGVRWREREKRKKDAFRGARRLGVGNKVVVEGLLGCEGKERGRCQKYAFWQGMRATCTYC